MIAIVLGAGRGVRMGIMKARLVVDGEALVVQHVRRLRELACTEIVVAVPSSFVEEARALAPARFIGLDTGAQAETLAAVLATLDPDPSAHLLITPIDLRPPRLDTLRALVAATGDAIVPCHAGRRGHPLIVRRGVLDGFDGRVPLDRFLGARRRELEVDDARVLGDLDVPADLHGDD